MRYSNQKGFVHPLFLILALAVVGVIGFATWQGFGVKNPQSENLSSKPTGYTIPTFKGVKTISLTGSAPQGLTVDSKTGYVYTGNNGDITTKCSNGRGGAGAATALSGGQVFVNKGSHLPPTQNGSMPPPVNNGSFLPPPNSGNTSMPPPTNSGALPPISGGNQSALSQNKPGFSSTLGGNTMSIIDPATSKEIKRVNSSGSPIWPLVDSAGGRVYLTVSSGYVDVYTLNGDKIQSIYVGGTPHDLGLDPSTGIMIVSNTTDTSGTYYSAIDTKSNSVLGHYKVPAEPHGIIVDETQHIAYMTTVADGEMVVIDMKTGQTKTSFVTGPKIFRGTNLMSFSPAKNQLFLAENYNGQRDIEVIDITSQSVKSKISMPAIPWGMSVDDSQHLLYVALPEVDSVAVVDINSGLILEQIPVDCAFAVRLDTTRGLGFATNIAKNSLSVFSLAQVVLDVKK